jgi:lipid II:glycine glycyltransferase (peptidoglycan interpeptide bridge formation enzyme)
MASSLAFEHTAFSQSQRASASYEIKPLEDRRWRVFLEAHPQSSVFHTAEWLHALRKTYGYEPIAFTTSAPGADLQNAAVFCKVESRLTGRRLVSVPFSDHCDLLVDAPRDLTFIITSLEKKLRNDKILYIETRPTHSLDLLPQGSPYSTFNYWRHHIDLTPSLDTLFANCHRDSTQRKIRRATREGLTVEKGRSELLLDCFYDLLLLTRRRHVTLPQPKRWFRALIDCFGRALTIRIASKDKQPIAAILTLSHKNTLYYKYGCSDAHFHRLGGVHLLLWRSIQEAKEDRLSVFDLGRSDCDNSGLIAFKDRWGAAKSALTYLRLSASAHSQLRFTPTGAGRTGRLARWLLPHLPDRMLCAAADLIYGHIG